MTENLAAMKASHDCQTADLFSDLDPPPHLAGPAAGYVLQLASVHFHHPTEPDQPWTLWSLAVADRSWSAWAASVAPDMERGWLDQVEHVWLVRDRALCQALVEMHTGLILQSRRLAATARPPAEGSSPP